MTLTSPEARQDIDDGFNRLMDEAKKLEGKARWVAWGGVFLYAIYANRHGDLSPDVRDRIIVDSPLREEVERFCVAVGVPFPEPAPVEHVAQPDVQPAAPDVVPEKKSVDVKKSWKATLGETTAVFDQLCIKARAGTLTGEESTDFFARVPSPPFWMSQHLRLEAGIPLEPVKIARKIAITAPAPEAAVQPEPQPDVQPEPEPEPKAAPVAEVEAQSHVETEPEPQPQPEPQPAPATTPVVALNKQADRFEAQTSFGNDWDNDDGRPRGRKGKKHRQQRPGKSHDSHVEH